MRLKRWLAGAAVLLAGIFCVVPVYAEHAGSALPVIATWQDGHGYQADGTQIAGGWAYDSVNPAGKYVLFGEDGTVLKKAEKQEGSELSSDYTGTELIPATIALRAEVFEGFQGTVTVMLEEKSGLSKSVELNDRNFFGLNIRVNSGDYTLKGVEAKEGTHSYAAEFSTVSVHIPEQEMRIMKIRVTDKELDVAEQSPKEEKTESKELQAEPQKQQKAGQKTETEKREEGSIMQDLGIKKVLAFAGGIGTVCLAGIWLLRKKRKKYR